MRNVRSPREARGARWVLGYATVDVSPAELVAPAGGPAVFGATSHLGVFSPSGFGPGFAGLCADPEDDVRAVVRLVATRRDGARAAVRDAARSLLDEAGEAPRVLMVHATPGFEERVLEGLADVAGLRGVPTFGGSAADDDLGGRWRVFHGSELLAEGVLLVGFVSPRRVHGAFVSGYFGTRRKGRATAVEDRTVYTIDGRPAAEVLDGWMGGRLAEARRAGGVVLAETTLAPIGRVVDDTHGVKRYLLSHPHRIDASNGAVSFFTEISEGDELELMMGTRGSLVDRVDQVTRRAQRAVSDSLLGGVLVYCGGCVGAVKDLTDDIAARFGRGLGGAPFVGAATFGEIGTFESSGAREPRHGNLMCDAVLFDTRLEDSRSTG